jgi:peptide/nickel transport system substrate-binding protein
MTVKFTLSAPYAPFLSNLAYPTGLIVSPAAVMEHGADFGRNPSGTGPFRFVEWRSNEAVVVEANPDYWDGAPALQAVVFRPITDANTRTAEMLAGGIDLMVEVPPVALSEFQGDGFTVHEQAGPHLWFLILNAKEGPFADKRVRQAANYAINKSAIVNDVLEGTAAVAAGPTPPAFAWAYNEGAGALSLRPREGPRTARRGRRRGRGADLLRHRGRLGHARPGGDGHRDAGRSGGRGLRRDHRDL